MTHPMRDRLVVKIYDKHQILTRTLARQIVDDILAELQDPDTAMIDAIRNDRAIRSEPAYCRHGVMKPLSCAPCREEAEAAR